jgi:hypothetical protein
MVQRVNVGADTDIGHHSHTVTSQSKDYWRELDLS